MEARIVITLKDEAATIGIQQPDCDPVFFTAGGGLPEVLAAIPTMLAEAQMRWQEKPKNPKTEAKLEPTPQPQTPTRQTIGRSSAGRQSRQVGTPSGQQALL